ncbi:MAG: hypothetical protein KGJ08_08880, partial [Gammaproteobacteria bacterium]|nr:hypothetical protein [Gammaproteobacteria bacterium]
QAQDQAGPWASPSDPDAKAITALEDMWAHTACSSVSRNHLKAMESIVRYATLTPRMRGAVQRGFLVQRFSRSLTSTTQRKVLANYWLVQMPWTARHVS